MTLFFPFSYPMEWQRVHFQGVDIHGMLCETDRNRWDAHSGISIPEFICLYKQVEKVVPRLLETTNLSNMAKQGRIV